MPIPWASLGRIDAPVMMRRPCCTYGTMAKRWSMMHSSNWQALYARSGQWEEAVPIWESLAARGVARAMERLAKYCEHRQRDFGAALHWTERMLALDYEVGSCEQRRLRLLSRRENARKHGP